MEALDIFKSQLQQVHDHRDKKGTYRNFHSILAVTIPGLLANDSSIDKLIRWIKLQKRTLFKYFEFSKPPCLKNHLGELVESYPVLKLLTGDAIFAQRPLLEAIEEYHLDYLFQVKENQPKVLEQMKLTFGDAPLQEPNARQVKKKG